ncbi:electron transfer flavoprotein beta subunit [Dyadobacter sp. BE34]|uniref:Electron transfer flavoprotein subunit beta n=1 Tax=Dyadobacter fermentans TaxID=94254 RepID=A0ABU1QWR5_9BACT|nr:MULTISPECIES: electron transfer flavoprotein subunit beta/FixA family protein [Dyadobacter]MDR6805604.1 electron transfer flavoprotein beta subunit [Dyadobacter fermentans]MDR7042636.1 electron transfer flavoprotein beta subunit [Dyadobacter sp. BE242]MDR7196948.1 electron transfer flavoprotein beta subunit [Dyadobacter sp. BE34]MDR7215617.1 electron transfer flavoprotein beta subunit [Dyadobacter sp. BE31]MDR7263153.1 electron transfer flavoprotein beta subunit [Dyadobacter sp. BE32]
MKILVCITNVPDTTAKISFTDNDTKLNKNGVQFIIGPYDDYALARGVELKEQSGGNLTVLHVGEADAEPQIRKALAIGADDAIRVNADPQDSYFVAAQIAHIASQHSYDLILMGRESIDYNSGVVHGLVGEMLGIPSYSPVMKLDLEGNTATITREIDGGKEVLKAPLPLVLGCQEPIAEWKIPNMRGIMTARTKPLNVVEPVSVDDMTVPQTYQLPAPKGACKMIPASEAETLIKLLQTEAKVL